jgi:hypothetical protein
MTRERSPLLWERIAADDCSSCGNGNVTEGEMPAKSKAQQKAAGAALSAKRGEQR